MVCSPVDTLRYNATRMLLPSSMCGKNGPLLLRQMLLVEDRTKRGFDRPRFSNPYSPTITAPGNRLCRSLRTMMTDASCVQGNGSATSCGMVPPVNVAVQPVGSHFSVINMIALHLFRSVVVLRQHEHPA